MKARVKATGEIVEVNKVTRYSPNYTPSVCYECLENGFPYKEEHLDFENITEGLIDVKEKSLPKDEPDYWERLKHQYAGMAMQGMMNNSFLVGEFKKDPNNGISDMSNIITKAAVIYATALVDKLKNEK